MTKEGTGVAADLTPLISSLFALIPIPVAVVATDGKVVLSNSAFSDLFQGTQNIQGLPHHELEIAGRGIYELETVRNVMQLREYQENVENIAITADLSDGLPYAGGDPNQIEQVLLNLIVNAEDAIADALRRPGAIHIKTSADNVRLQVTVTDNG